MSWYLLNTVNNTERGDDRGGKTIVVLGCSWEQGSQFRKTRDCKHE